MTCESKIREFLMELETFVNYKTSQKTLEHESWYHGQLAKNEEMRQSAERRAEVDGRMAIQSWGRLEKILGGLLTCFSEKE